MYITQPYVPPIEKYIKYVEQAFDRKWLTNEGPLLSELTTRLKEYLNVEHLLIVSNGTIALQLAYKIKDLANKKVITTPFTFPATSTALDWQGAKTSLADINQTDWNLSAESVEQMLENNSADAIVPVNIFGAPCDLAAFDRIGEKYNIPIIYDSAQAMLTQYKGKSIFCYGDIHCISFHATKLFHSVEGGALVFKNKEDLELAQKLINFGIDSDGQVLEAGINGKMSELHAAMGLCILDDLPELIENRQSSVAQYQQELNGVVTFQKTDVGNVIPPMYMPVKFNSEQALLDAADNLKAEGYNTRRYFYPKSHKYLSNYCKSELPVSEQVTDKILCLPLMHNLDNKHIKKISNIIKKI